MTKNILFFLLSFTLLTSFNNGSGGAPGEKNNGESLISISPNPIKDRAHVFCNYYINKIEVFNLVGTNIGEYNGGEMIDLTNQSRGYYLIKVFTPQGEFIKRIYKD